VICPQCQREIADYSSFCYYCGARQQAAAKPAGPPRRLRRSATDRMLGGVCAGVADYLDVDSTIVRLVWLLLVIFPVPLVPAILGYLIAWMVIPTAVPSEAPAPARRLLRSRTDRQLAGVCGGIAEYLGADSTIIRVVWAILSVVPGAIIGGLIAYLVAWIVIPEAPAVAPVAAAVPGQPGAQS